MSLKPVHALPSWIIILAFTCLCPVESFKLLEELFKTAYDLVNDWDVILPYRKHCHKLPEDYCFFFLHTRDRPEDLGQTIMTGDDAGLKKSSFNGEHNTKVLIHGFLDTVRLSHWFQEMKDALLKQGDYNVIIVDWGCGNGFPFSKAVKNVKVTAEKVKGLIEFLMKKTKAKPEDFHLIGHSLGGQMVGIIGNNLPNIGRISSLDPAGPGFYNVSSIKDRITSKSGIFVDVLHSNSGNLLQDLRKNLSLAHISDNLTLKKLLPYLNNVTGVSYYPPVGHLDFYPNGGQKQSGCRVEPFADLVELKLVRAVATFALCDHMRSVFLYTDSIVLEHACIGVLCHDYDTFHKGNCPRDCSSKGHCALMGFYSDKFYVKGMEGDKNRFFMNTNSDVPYCDSVAQLERSKNIPHQNPSVAAEQDHSDNEDPSVATEEPHQNPSVTAEHHLHRNPSVTSELDHSGHQDPSEEPHQNPSVTTEHHLRQNPSVTAEHHLDEYPSVTAQHYLHQDSSVTAEQHLQQNPSVTAQHHLHQDPSVKAEHNLQRDPSMMAEHHLHRSQSEMETHPMQYRN